MTVEDLELKREKAGGSQKDIIDAIYNVGIALIEAMNESKSDDSIFQQVFGGKK